MTKIDIFSGFLGAGKTTLIKKMIAEAYAGEKLVLIENEFGEIGIDGGFLKEAGIEITEMNSGCICCSLVGDFGRALERVITEYAPDRILIEPSGVGKLSDVMHAVAKIDAHDVVLGGCTAVVDAKKCRMYMSNFGEFFNDQVESATAIVLSHTDTLSPEKIAACVALLRTHNEKATIVTTPWSQLTGAQLRAAIEQENTLAAALHELEEKLHAEEHHHEHHHHHDGEECADPHCECHHHHEDEDHHHHEGEECHHEHHHHADEPCDDPHCECHHDHGHGHHHHHHADEVFSTFGTETTRFFTEAELAHMLEELDSGAYGTVLRAKGILPKQDGGWIHFDYIPGEPDIRTGAADITGRLCVIGAGIREDALKTLFRV